MDPLTTDERIAALLDGKLGEQERAALLAELGLSRDELEILLNSAATLSELEEEDRAAGAIPIGAPRAAPPEPRKVRTAVWRRPAVLSAAAAAVLAIGGGLLLTRDRGGPSSASAVYALANPGRGLPYEQRTVLPANRGPDEGALGRRGAVRFGVLAADLEIAANAGHRQQFSALADSIADLLGQAGNRGAGDYEQLASAGRIPSRRERARLQEETTETMDPAMAALGDWAEAARVATHFRDQAFFRSRISARYLHPEPSLRLPDPVMARLDSVRDAVPAKGAPDWTRLESALSDLLKEAG
jgi:hypothetical protein